MPENNIAQQVSPSEVAQPKEIIEFDTEKQSDLNALAAVLPPELRQVLNKIHVEANAISTNDFTVLAFGNKDVRAFLEKKYPGKLKELVNIAVEHSRINNERLQTRIESEKADTKMLRIGQVAGICFISVALITGGWLLYKGQYSVGVFLILGGLASPLINDLVSVLSASYSNKIKMPK